MHDEEDTLFRKALNYDPVREEEKRIRAEFMRQMSPLRGETPFFCRLPPEMKDAENKRERPWFSYVENIQKADDSPVRFICPKLETVVRGTLRKGEGAITRREMASLPISLREPDLIPPSIFSDIWLININGITDLTGLEHATFVRILRMSVFSGYCKIPDLAPLAKLTKLETVSFENGGDPPEDQKAMIEKALPNCDIRYAD